MTTVRSYGINSIGDDTENVRLSVKNTSSRLGESLYGAARFHDSGVVTCCGISDHALAVFLRSGYKLSNQIEEHQCDCCSKQ